MSAHGYRYPQASSVELARAALKHGPFVPQRDGNYSTGRRSFAAKSINALLATGEAVRVGTGVVHADHLKP